MKSKIKLISSRIKKDQEEKKRRREVDRCDL